MDWWTALCYAVFVLTALGQVLMSVLIAPFVWPAERPRVTCRPTPRNTRIVAASPSLRCFDPTFWAVGPYAQTLAAVLLRPSPSKYRRQMVAMADGVEVALDWRETPAMRADAPIVFCCHGLGGSSHSRYMQLFTDRACQRGFRAVVYNRRGHGGAPMPPAFPRHWDARDMDDVVAHVTSAFPTARMAAVGFSLGALLVCNYQAATGSSSPFEVAVSAGQGYDMGRGTRWLAEEAPFLDGIMCHFLRRLLTVEQLDSLAMQHARSLRDLEAASGLPDLEGYYAHCSSAGRLTDVVRPLLCVGSWDDPFVPHSLTALADEAAGANSNIISVTTRRGGHMGWLAGAGGRPWLPDVCLDFITAAEELLSYEQSTVVGPHAETGQYDVEAI